MKKKDLYYERIPTKLLREDIKLLAINSFKSSFLNKNEKKKWIDQINNLN